MTIKSFDQIIDEMLSAQQWLGIIRAEDDGLLPTCCGNISDLRDDIMSFLRQPHAISAAHVVAGINGHDMALPMKRFADALAITLNATHPDWRKFYGAADEGSKIAPAVGISLPRDEITMSAYLPISAKEASALVNESIHEGLRRSNTGLSIWKFIQTYDATWVEALAYAVANLEKMGMTICRKVET